MGAQVHPHQKFDEKLGARFGNVVSLMHQLLCAAQPAEEGFIIFLSLFICLHELGENESPLA
jgi:hypothetical protein